MLLLLLQGHPVHGLLTDRRIILRESSGSCGFPLDLCCVCFKVRCARHWTPVRIFRIKIELQYCLSAVLTSMLCRTRTCNDPCILISSREYLHVSLRKYHANADQPSVLHKCCCCCQAETDSSYSILDLKSVQPYVASGCAADCMATMFKLATTNPFCGCLPKMLPNGVRLGFSRIGRQHDMHMPAPR
jgi:hypothetical protein